MKWMSSPSISVMKFGTAFSFSSHLRQSCSCPIACECLHHRQLHALRLIFDGLPFGPPRRRDAPAEVVEFLFRNVNVEVADCDLFPNLVGHGALLSLNRPSLVTI